MYQSRSSGSIAGLAGAEVLIALATSGGGTNTNLNFNFGSNRNLFENNNFNIEDHFDQSIGSTTGSVRSNLDVLRKDLPIGNYNSQIQIPTIPTLFSTFQSNSSSIPLNFDLKTRLPSVTTSISEQLKKRNVVPALPLSLPIPPSNFHLTASTRLEKLLETGTRERLPAGFLSTLSQLLDEGEKGVSGELRGESQIARALHNALHQIQDSTGSNSGTSKSTNAMPKTRGVKRKNKNEDIAVPAKVHIGNKGDKNNEIQVIEEKSSTSFIFVYENGK